MKFSRHRGLSLFIRPVEAEEEILPLLLFVDTKEGRGGSELREVLPAHQTCRDVTRVVSILRNSVKLTKMRHEILK
jgi:hypothetical protein